MVNKIIFFIIVLTTLSPIYSQIYENVVQVDSTQKSVLYERSLRWFIKNAENSNYVIKLKDPEKGEVYAKLSFDTPEFKVKGRMNDWASAINRMIVYKATGDISVQILCKDNRYKYFIEITNVEIIEKLNDGNYAINQKTKDIQKSKITIYIPQFINSIIDDINNHMNSMSDFETNDW